MLSDRAENIRRVAEVSKLFADGGIVALSSFISPYNADRKLVRLFDDSHKVFSLKLRLGLQQTLSLSVQFCFQARDLHAEADLPFVVCHVATPLNVCEARDPKGLYKKARAGEIKGFTGVDSAYEEPEKAEITVGADGESIDVCVRKVCDYLEEKEIIPGTHPKITELFVPASERAAKTAEAASLPKLNIDKVSMQWLQVLAEGWASPLTGFMRESEFLRSLHFNCLDAHTNQSVPIVLPCNDEEKAAIAGKDAITLVYEGKDVAIMRTPEVFDAIKEERCARQFGLHHKGHPYVDMVYAYGDFLVGGDLEVLEEIKWNDGLDEFRKTPLQLRAEFKKLGCDAVYAFQLRNPIHNGHALLMQDTHEKLVARGFKKPVLLLHPLGGWTKEDDVPLPVRIQQHKAVLAEHVLKPENTVLAIFPSPMVYAGPTEVQWHAKSRENAGASFYIVGRDPAGMGHPIEDRNMFQAHHGRDVLQMAPGLKSLEIIPFRVAAYNDKKGAMDFFDPAKAEDFTFISGTKMRKFARTGVAPPDGFMCPSGWKIVSEFYLNRAKEAEADK